MRSNIVQTGLNSLCSQRNEDELLNRLPLHFQSSGIAEVHQQARVRRCGSKPAPHAREASTLPPEFYPQLFVGNVTC